jgi:hypothetical protein
MDAVSKLDYIALEMVLISCSLVHSYTQKISKIFDLYIASNDMSVKVGVILVSCTCIGLDKVS